MKLNINLKQCSLSSITKEQILQQAPKAVSLLKDGLKELLGSDFKIIVDYAGDKRGIMSGSMYITFYRAHNPEPANGISRNSRSYANFIMHLLRENSTETQLPNVKLEMVSGFRNPKYRVISSKKSLEDVATKFLAWVEKNADVIKSL